jgi:chaperonin GroEL
VALLRAARALKPASSLTGDERTGFDIIIRACTAPIYQIAENAGQDGGVVVAKVAEGKGNFGYDALKDEYTDLVKAGIIDPTKVARSALQNAASVSTLLLTSDALIADMPKEEKKETGGGHGGYDDMY